MLIGSGFCGSQGAALRNPSERPDLFADPAVIQRRVERFTRELGLNAARAQSWAFAQAVLAAIWGIEDGIRVEPDRGWLALAALLRVARLWTKKGADNAVHGD
jgi:streptomycin 6-kinase